MNQIDGLIKINFKTQFLYIIDLKGIFIMKTTKISRLMFGLSTPILLVLPFSSLASCTKDSEYEGEGVFETDPWGVVLRHANLGLDDLKEYYQLDSFVGLQKEITIDGYNYHLRVIGENQDHLADIEGKPQMDKPAALTFIFEEVIQQKNEESGYYEPKETIYTEGSRIEGDAIWDTSIVREYLNGKFLKKLNAALGSNSNKVGVKTVSKNTIIKHGSGEVSPAAERVFLPSLGDFFTSQQLPEVLGDSYNENAYIEEGISTPYNSDVYTRYSYYYDKVTEDCVDEEYESIIHNELAMYGATDGGFESYWLRTCKPGFGDDWNEWYLSVDYNEIEEENECRFKITPFDHAEEDYVKAGMAPIFCI